MFKKKKKTEHVYFFKKTLALPVAVPGNKLWFNNIKGSRKTQRVKEC